MANRFDIEPSQPQKSTAPAQSSVLKKGELIPGYTPPSTRISAVDVLKQLYPSAQKVGKAVAKLPETIFPAATEGIKTSGKIFGEGLAYLLDENVREQYAKGNVEILPTITQTTLKDVSKKTGAAMLEATLYKVLPPTLKQSIYARGGIGALKGVAFAISEGMAKGYDKEQIMKNALLYAPFGAGGEAIAPYIGKLLEAKIQDLPKVTGKSLEMLRKELSTGKPIETAKDVVFNQAIKEMKKVYSQDGTPVFRYEGGVEAEANKKGMALIGEGTVGEGKYFHLEPETGKGIYGETLKKQLLSKDAKILDLSKSKDLAKNPIYQKALLLKQSLTEYAEKNGYDAIKFIDETNNPVIVVTKKSINKVLSTSAITPEGMLDNNLVKGRISDVAARLEREVSKEASETFKKEIAGKTFKDYDDFISTSEKIFKDIKEVGKTITPKSPVEASKIKVPEVIKPVAIPETPTQKLIRALDEAKSVRGQAESLYSKERTIRAGKGAEALEKEKGKVAFELAKEKLSGELPKPQYEPLKLSGDDINSLADEIRVNEDLMFYDKVSAYNGLMKVIGEDVGGRIPQERELELLRTVFGKEVVESIMKKRSLLEKGVSILGEATTFPRTMLTSLDFSAALNQGAVLGTYRPQAWANSFKEMFAYAFKSGAYDNAMEAIAKKELYPLMRKTGLYLPDTAAQTVYLSQREEQFLSKWATMFPVLGPGVRASERAYIGFLNKLRADVFEDVAKKFISEGITFEENPQIFKALSNFVNTASGRGEIGKLGEQASVFLNAMFFSPRYQMSRVQMMNPGWYIKQPRAVRKQAAIAMVKYIGVVASVLSMAKMAGAEVTINPTDTDFGRIKIGKVSYNPLSGFQPWIRVTAQIIMNGRVNSKDKFEVFGSSAVGTQSGLDWLFRFSQTKFAPVPSLISDLLRRETLMGEKLTVQGELLDKFVPIYIQDITDAVQEAGLEGGIMVGLPAFFGVSTQVYTTPKKEKKKKNINRFD